jgi:glutathione S-transferase
VICSYLNKVFGWGPPDIRSQTHIDQILAVVVDAVAEGRLAFHPVDFYATHKIQASRWGMAPAIFD